MVPAVVLAVPAELVVAVVVVADTEAREAENEEQRPRLMDAASWRRVPVQAEMRQGAMAAWREEKPVPHWQASSVTAQPATEMAEVRQGIYVVVG